MPIKLELESTLFPNEKLTSFQSNSKEISAKRRFDNLSNNNNNTRKGEWFAHTWLSTRGRSNPRNIEDLVEIYLAINRAGQKKKKKSIFSTHDARTSGTRVPSGLLSRIHTLEAYTRNTNIMESAGYGEGRGGREEGSASSQRGTIGARVMRRPPTKRS